MERARGRGGIRKICGEAFGQRCKSIWENSKPPYAKPACWAPKFVGGLYVWATRPSDDGQGYMPDPPQVATGQGFY